MNDTSVILKHRVLALDVLQCSHGPCHAGLSYRESDYVHILTRLECEVCGPINYIKIPNSFDRSTKLLSKGMQTTLTFQRISHIRV